MRFGTFVQALRKKYTQNPGFKNIALMQINNLNMNKNNAAVNAYIEYIGGYHIYFVQG